MHANVKKAISFCITSRNRLWQLEQTLQKNLSNLHEDHEICLVDYGSTDGLSAWIWKNFAHLIEDRKLCLFEVKNSVSWNASKAKNLAHRIAHGDYFFNLDADNFISARDVRNIERAYQSNVPSHQFSGTFGDGSYGRIGCPRTLFYELGGYDETLLPMGGQDVDILNRMTAASRRLLKLPPPRSEAIQNTLNDKIREIHPAIPDPKSFYASMNLFNIQKSNHRLEVEGPIRTDGFATFRGLLNGTPVIIDGLNHIRPDTGGIYS